MIHALHGNFGLPSDWDAALPPGVPARAWHLWDIRRHHPEALTLTGFATWFNDEVAALPDKGPRVLAGYSLGGRLALHVLQDRPELWHRALLLSTHPGLTTTAARQERLRHDLFWQTRCLTDPWPQVCAAWNAQPVLQSNAPLPDLTLLEPWRLEIAGAFSDWSLGQQEIPPHPLHISGYWITGTQDVKFHSLDPTLLPGPFFNPLAAEGAGHRLLLEAPTMVRAILAQTPGDRHMKLPAP